MAQCLLWNVLGNKSFWGLVFIIFPLQASLNKLSSWSHAPSLVTMFSVKQYFPVIVLAHWPHCYKWLWLKMQCIPDDPSSQNCIRSLLPSHCLVERHAWSWFPYYFCHKGVYFLEFTRWHHWLKPQQCTLSWGLQECVSTARSIAEVPVQKLFKYQECLSACPPPSRK